MLLLDLCNNKFHRKMTNGPSSVEFIIVAFL